MTPQERTNEPVLPNGNQPEQRSPLSSVQLAMVQTLHHAGFSAHSIASSFRVSPATVRKWAKRPQVELFHLQRRSKRRWVAS